MPVVKMLLQSVVSDDAEFMTIDIKDFYLNTELPRSEWMRLPVKFLSSSIMDKYKLHQFIHDGAVLFEVVKSLYGLPHARKYLRTRSLRTWLLMDTTKPPLLASFVMRAMASPSPWSSMTSVSNSLTRKLHNTSSIV